MVKRSMFWPKLLPKINLRSLLLYLLSVAKSNLLIMENEHLLALKNKLQSCGALRPEAWERIVQLQQQTSLKTGESFVRKQGTLAYIANGLLKEYDAQYRKNPSIINFIVANQCLVTRKHNQNHYLKAYLTTLVYYWDFEDLQQLYQEFKELKTIYDSVCAAYDEDTAYRLLILEEHYAGNRLKLFIKKYRDILPLLKKKDMANYVQMTYNHFIQAYNHLL